MTEKDEAETASEHRLVHGQLCYLQIPALDAMKSAEFYEKVFGWRIERPYTSFEAPGIIGQWVTDRQAAPQAGPLAWIWVDSIERVFELARANGGEVLESPSTDGPRLLATIRDPGGNAIGLAQHGAR